MIFKTQTDAIEFRDTTIDLIDSIAPDTNIYDDLMSLRASIIEDINVRIIELPKVKRINQNAILPALAVSYSLFQNVDNEQDIIDRNNISNPVFVTGTIEYVAP